MYLRGKTKKDKKKLNTFYIEMNEKAKKKRIILPFHHAIFSLRVYILFRHSPVNNEMKFSFSFAGLLFSVPGCFREDRWKVATSFLL